MSDTLQVEILAPAKIVARVTASAIYLPAYDGEIGILPDHTAFVSELGTGELKIQGASANIYFISGGYIEVVDNKVKVLVDVCENKETIDLARAESAKKRALDRLYGNTEFDLLRAQSALTRAESRLSMISR